jgi:hypothetical protein
MIIVDCDVLHQIGVKAMEAMRPPLVTKFPLDGWDPDQLGPSLHEYRVEYMMRTDPHLVRSGGISRSPDLRLCGGTEANEWIWIFWVAADERKSHELIRVLGDRGVITRFKCWRESERLKVKAYCYFEEARPEYDYIHE